MVLSFLICTVLFNFSCAFPGVLEDQDMFSGLLDCWLNWMAPQTSTYLCEEGQSEMDSPLNSQKEKSRLSGFDLVQKLCSEDMLIKGKIGSLLFPFSIWKEGLIMQYEPASICFEICPWFLLC